MFLLKFGCKTGWNSGSGDGRCFKYRPPEVIFSFPVLPPQSTLESETSCAVPPLLLPSLRILSEFLVAKQRGLRFYGLDGISRNDLPESFCFQFSPSTGPRC